MWFISQVELAETQLEPAADHVSHQVIWGWWGAKRGGKKELTIFFRIKKNHFLQ